MRDFSKCIKKYFKFLSQLFFLFFSLSIFCFLYFFIFPLLSIFFLSLSLSLSSYFFLTLCLLLFVHLSPSLFTLFPLLSFFSFSYLKITCSTGCPDQIGRNFKIRLFNNQNTCIKYKDSFGIVRNRAIWPRNKSWPLKIGFSAAWCFSNAPE